MAACSSLRRNAAESKIGASSATLSLAPMVLLTCMVIARSPVFCSDGVQEPAESLIEGIRTFQVCEMADAGQLDILCGRNVRRGLRHHGRRRSVVLATGQQQ